VVRHVKYQEDSVYRLEGISGNASCVLKREFAAWPKNSVLRHSAVFMAAETIPRFNSRTAAHKDHLSAKE
jgi:hypothetical protein